MVRQLCNIMLVLVTYRSFYLKLLNIQSRLLPWLQCVICHETFASKSTISLPSKVPVIFMSSKPLLSNSFRKCRFMSLVFSLNRLLSIFWSRLFISMPIISIFFLHTCISSCDLDNVLL